MMDDCKAQQIAVLDAFPDATILLCTFHILQSCWRWLWDQKHGVEMSYRRLCYKWFQDLVYAQEEVLLEQRYRTRKFINI